MTAKEANTMYSDLLIKIETTFSFLAPSLINSLAILVVISSTCLYVYSLSLKTTAKLFGYFLAVSKKSSKIVRLSSR